MRIYLCLLASMVLVLSSCTSTPTPEGKPLPDLTFAHVEPIPVKASAIQIDNLYDPNTEKEEGANEDVSIQFPVAPDMAAQRYAEKRFKPDLGAGGTFFFVIEDSFVKQSEVEPAGSFAKWTGLENKDRYDVYLTLRLYQRKADGTETKHAVLNFNRYITIPQRYSLARKEEAKFRFIEYLVSDIDEALLEVIADRMDLFSDSTVQYLDHLKMKDDEKTVDTKAAP